MLPEKSRLGVYLAYDPLTKNLLVSEPNGRKQFETRNKEPPLRKYFSKTGKCSNISQPSIPLIVVLLLKTLGKHVPTLMLYLSQMPV